MTLDLFKPLVSDDRMHPNFFRILRDKTYRAERETIQSWANGFVDRDGKNKFVKEFQTSFNSSFWELYLFKLFNEMNWLIDLSYNRPDFFLSTPFGQIVVEAVTANAPDQFRPEWASGFNYTERALERIDMEELLRLASIRILQAITSKYNKYVKEYQSLSHVAGKPFVICLAPFEQPFFFLQGNLAMTRVLYGYDQPIITKYWPEDWNNSLGVSESLQVQKKPGMDLNIALFTKPGMEEISAIFFSTAATFSKVKALSNSTHTVLFNAVRYREDQTQHVEFINELQGTYEESIFDGLQVFFNPFAKYPLNPELFNEKEVLLHFYDINSKSYDLQIPDRFLYFRRAISFSNEELEEEISELLDDIEKSSEGLFKQLDEEIWNEGEWRYVGGSQQFCKNHHMAHYKGWTLVVFLDTIDNEWAGIAKNSKSYTLPAFIASAANMEMVIDHQTKEEAFEAIKNKIP